MISYFGEFVVRLVAWILGVTLLIGLVALAAFRMGGPPTPPKKSPAEVLREAGALTASGHHEEALPLYDAALGDKPRDTSGLLARGMCLLALDRTADAERDFERCVRLEPTNWEAIAQIGRTRAMRDDHVGALEAFERALALGPGTAEIWFWKAGALFRLGRDAEAEIAYGKAIELNPLLGGAFEARGQVRLQKRDFARALADFNVARQMLPPSTTLLSGMGLALMAVGRLQEADAAFSEAIQIDPRAARTYHNRALARFAMGQHPAALQDAETALRIDPSLAKVFLLRGMILAKATRHIEAIANITEALRLQPDDPEALRHRAASLRAIGREDLARHDEDLASRTAPSLPGDTPTQPQPR